MGSTIGRVLVVDDEEDLAEPVITGLREQGFETGYARDGASAIALLSEVWDVVLLDLMLPDMSGEAVLNFARRTHPAPFVLVVSARTTVSDKLSLFRIGCDDYICKPFSLEELFERVRAVIRRKQESERPSQVLHATKEIELDTTLFSLKYRGKSVSLTPKETAILHMLLAQPGKIVHRREILHSVWGLKKEPDTNFIGVHFSNLRRKLSKVGCADNLETIRNSGFRFEIANDS